MPAQPIDPDKLRVAIRKMSDTQVYYMLEEAIDLLPQTKLHKLVARFLDPGQLRPDSKTKGSLLKGIKAFQKASLEGRYYEGFNVNSKNHMEMSKGTRAWIAECNRLLDRCVAAVGKQDLTDTQQAFDIIFGLLDRVDECHDDILFFADEGGSWQVGVDWQKVLAAYFTCLSATSEPDEYARRVFKVIEAYDSYSKAKHLATARKNATPPQRKALRKAP
ncbi:MAG: hypothetical protein ISS70_24255 [Phycisphaerae bacterium]|nr:hypothetical protein [Phycisphaerae bacterium]